MTDGGFGVILTVSGLSDTGRQRDHNEDTLLVADLGLDPWTGSSPEVVRKFEQDDSFEVRVGHKGFLLMVADGMGGGPAGEVASHLTVDSIHERLRRTWSEDESDTPRSFTRALEQAVAAASRDVYQTAVTNATFEGMGSTVTVAVVLDGMLYLAQVGDSRAYLVRHGEAVQLTRDQSVVEHLLRTGKMTETQARLSRNRNVLLQAMGTQTDIGVDLSYQGLRLDDRIVLCSDGLSGPVSNAEIGATVSRHPNPAAACRELVELANIRGGADNITVVVARAGGPALRSPLVDDQVGHTAYPLDTA